MSLQRISRLPFLLVAATLLPGRPLAAQSGAELVAPADSAQSAATLIARGDSAQAAFHPIEALKHYQSALALDSTNAKLLASASRSAVDVGEGETDEARKRELFRTGERYARRAVKADSAYPEAWFDLARALGRTALSVGVRERVRYAVEIRECALAALRLDPDHPGALHVIGVWNAEILRLNGMQRFFARNFMGGKVFGLANWKDAVSYMERAVAIDPERLSHHLDLAKIYAETGEKAKAREQYEFVIKATKRTDVNDPAYKQQAAAELARLK